MSSPNGAQIPKNSSTVFPSMSTVVPNMDEDELDLLLKMLKYDPSERISPKKKKKTIEHPYIDNLDKDYLQSKNNDDPIESLHFVNLD